MRLIPFTSNRLQLCSTPIASPLECWFDVEIRFTRWERALAKSPIDTNRRNQHILTSHRNGARIRLRWRWICHTRWLIRQKEKNESDNLAERDGCKNSDKGCYLEIERALREEDLLAKTKAQVIKLLRYHTEIERTVESRSIWGDAMEWC